LKLIVENPNSIVTDAFIKSSELSFSLFINTVEKWVMFDSYICGPMEITWNYDKDEQSDTVTLIAETEHEKEILNRMHFTQHCKDQLWILLPDDKVIS